MPHLSCISRDICELTPISDEFSSDLLGTGFFEAVSLLAGVMERGGCFLLAYTVRDFFFFFLLCSLAPGRYCVCSWGRGGF